MKTAVVVLSDPQSGSDEALGRFFNALFLTYELKEKGEDVTLVFQGAGVRWTAAAAEPSHPAHALYVAVRDKLVVCGGCADVFGATAQAESSGLRLVRERNIPGTSGVVDLSRYLDGGARLLTF